MTDVGEIRLKKERIIQVKGYDIQIFSDTESKKKFAVRETPPYLCFSDTSDEKLVDLVEEALDLVEAAKL